MSLENPNSTSGYSDDEKIPEITMEGIEDQEAEEKLRQSGMSEESIRKLMKLKAESKPADQLAPGERPINTYEITEEDAA